jgi:hypothetical protein
MTLRGAVFRGSAPDPDNAAFRSGGANKVKSEVALGVPSLLHRRHFALLLAFQRRRQIRIFMCGANGWRIDPGRAPLNAQSGPKGDRPTTGDLARPHPMCQGSGDFGSAIFAARPPHRCRSSVVEHSLGKGEVVSSILTGSTRKIKHLS